ncbi:MAG: PHP domain-containing protein, partial [Bifidobacteriaceae bacterium]|nr:PHP domain-containing protein [Bifidobacteriaceae bacterium]
MTEHAGTKYAELHAHSAFSFLDGCSQPADLAYQAAKLGLSSMAITDHDGLYGVVQFADAAREVGLPTVFGAELTLDGGEEVPGADDPAGTHLLVLARGPEGYKRLSRSIAQAYLAVGEKGPPRYDLEALAAAGAGEWLVLTGCRKGAVRRALAAGGAAGRATGGTSGVMTGGTTSRMAADTTGHAAGGLTAGVPHGIAHRLPGDVRDMTGLATGPDGIAQRELDPQVGTGVRRQRPGTAQRGAQWELDRLVGLFGRDNVAVEITDSGSPGDPRQIAALAELALAARLPLVATGNVHYAHTDQFAMASAMAAIRGRRSLAEM